MRGCAAALLLIVLLAWAPAAGADHHDSNLPWPNTLPPQEVSSEVQPHGVKNCRRASMRCLDDLVKRLGRQWRPLHAACDHRAVFSYSYLTITKGIRADLRRRQPRFFRHKRWFIYIVAQFSNDYFKAFRGYERGEPIPDAWRITFDAAARGDYHAGQDVLLASNAHVQHDLPFAMAEMGLRARNGESHKPDHDGVNEINSRVFDPIEDFIAANYDESFTWVDAKPSPLDEMGALEFVKTWREGAWRNAERLLAARTPEERRKVEDDIRLTSRLWAEHIARFEMPGHRAARDGFCRAQQAR